MIKIVSRNTIIQQSIMRMSISIKGGGYITNPLINDFSLNKFSEQDYE